MRCFFLMFILPLLFMWNGVYYLIQQICVCLGLTEPKCDYEPEDYKFNDKEY
jgi:hypothetical protein